MSELHSTIVKTVVEGLIGEWEKKNPKPLFAYSEAVKSEILTALKDTIEFKMTSTLFKNKNTVPDNMLTGSVAIISEQEGPIESEFFLKTEEWDSLSDELYTAVVGESKIFNFVSRGSVFVRIPNKSGMKKERDFLLEIRKKMEP